MKKALGIILAVTLCLGWSVPVFASDPITTAGGNETADVQAKYVSGISSPIVYSVDVTWGAMEFTYTASGTKTWDPSSHTYTDNTTGSWSANGNTVEVTNHSNAAVGVVFSYESLAAYSAITGSFDKTGTTRLAAGSENKPNEATNVTARLTLSGSISKSLTSFTKVGTITVTLTTP